MSSTAPLQHKSRSDHATVKTPTGSGAKGGSPAYLGGAAPGWRNPAYLQRQPEEILEEDALPGEGALQRLPGDPFPAEDDDEAAPVLQAKLEINAPGDAHEAEADRVADAVTSGRSASPRPVSGAAPKVQRKCAQCGGDHEGDQPCPACAAKAQRKPAVAGAAPAPSPHAAQAVSRPGAGTPLAPQTRAPIEAHLSTDLSHVRVHDDSDAQRAAGSIGAKAFTHGDHIWLGRGQSTSDLGLMAHEATHTVQQRKGAGKPALIQRAPADHQHAEDGAAPRARIEGELDKEKEDKGERDEDEPVPEIDPAEKRAKAGPLVSKAKPDTDRPAAEAPKVEQAAEVVKTEADQPGEPMVEGQSDAPNAEAAPAAPAPAAGDPVAAATAAVAALPEPDAPEPVEVPAVARPVDAEGRSLPAEAQSEAMVIAAAAQLQVLREAAHGLRRKAVQQRANAILLRGNIALADGHIGEAETGLTTAHGHMDTRREVIGEAENAHATSEAKADQVTADAPGIQSQAEEAQAESGPMASEASDTAAQSSANAPDDSDGAADAEENSAQMNSVASDSASMDEAANASQARAVELQADAAAAKGKNESASAAIEASSAAADQTDAKLTEMDGQTTTARGQLEPLKSKPAAAEARADTLDAEAAAADARTDALAAQILQIQSEYVSDMGRVPGAEAMAERNQGALQRQEDSGGVPGGAAIPAPQAFAPRGYEGRRKVELPTFQMGPPLTEEQRRERAEAAAAAEERRRSRITSLQDGAYGNFADLSATDKAGIALDFMLEDAFSKASNIKWPDFSAESVGKALLNVIDPRGPLNGILGGLSTIASGTLNLFDPDQWARDPLGNLLKSAADIATGITVVLGSIVALLGVVVAISAALIVLSWFTLAPALTPVIAWCTSAGITVGGWTISVGLQALYYQSLLIIKNLVDVMTAETAEELVVNTEQMESDFSQVGEIGMQMGTAYLGAKGGPGMLDDLATNGIRTVAKQEVMEGLKGAAIEVATGEDISGVIGVARMAHGVHAHATAGGGGGSGTPHAEADGRAPHPEGAEAPAPKAEADAAEPRAADPAGEATPVARPDEAPPPADTPPPSTGALALPDPAGAGPRMVDGPEPVPSTDMGSAHAPVPEPNAAPAPGAVEPPKGQAGDATQGAGAKPAIAPEGDTPRPTAPEAPKLEPDAPAARPDEAGPRPSDTEATDGHAASGRADAQAPAVRPEGEAGKPHANEAETGPPRPEAEDPAALRDSAGTKKLPELSPAERRAEAAQANTAPREEVVNPALRSLDFDAVAHLDNGMDYAFSPERGAACRIANTGCGSTDGSGRIPEEGLSGEPRLEAEVDQALAGSGDATPAAHPGDTPGDPPRGGADPETPSPAREPASDAGAATGTEPGTPPARPGEGDATTPLRPAEGEAPGGAAAEKPRTTDQTGEADTGKPRPEGDGGTPAEAGLPPRTDDPRADAKAMDGRRADPDVVQRMQDLGYIPVRNGEGEIIAFRRQGAAGSDLPAVTVQDGRIVDVAHRVPPPPGSEPIRVAPDGEHWIENKDGTFRPVSEMADPARAGDDGRRHNPEVGRWGEVQADQFAASLGWEKLNGDPTHMNSDFSGPQRLDAVYRDPGPPVRIIVGDAKVLDSPQGETESGRQMSDQWIQDRVGSADLPEDIQRQIEAGDYEAVILRVDKYGNVTLEPLDVTGNPVRTPQGSGDNESGGSGK